MQSQVLALLDDIQERLDIAMMQRGQVIEYGTAEQILGNPRAGHIRQLIEVAPGRSWDFAAFTPVA